MHGPMHWATDLPIPAALGLVFHSLWTFALVYGAINTGLPHGCNQTTSIKFSLMYMVVTFAITTAAEAWLLAESLKGE